MIHALLRQRQDTFTMHTNALARRGKQGLLKSTDQSMGLYQSEGPAKVRFGISAYARETSGTGMRATRVGGVGGAARRPACLLLG